MKNYPHLFARLFNAPLLMHPSKLHAIVSGLAGRFGLDPPEPGLYITPSGTASKGGYRVIDGVGVIDIFGVLAHRTTMAADSSYIQGYDGIARRLDAALADRAVDSIVLNIDSPGGEVSGAFQLAEHIRSARSVKPIHAVANELAASAGYLIASAAQTLSLPETAEIGSIGVVTCHVDMSGAFAKQGVKVTPIFAGSHKVDGNPYEPLPDEVAQRLQSDINHYYSLFMDAVAESRPNLSRDAIRKTEAALFIGQSAIKVGLADRLETADQLISRLASEHRKATSRSYPAPRAAQSESKKMTDEITEAPAAPAYLSAADVASLCIGAGETALGRSLVGGQHTAESVAKRLADAREIRKMAMLNRMPEEAERLIVAGLTPEQAGPLLVTESAHRADQRVINSAVGVDVVGDSRARRVDGITHALCIRAGLEKDDPKNEFRGLSLTDVARSCLIDGGLQVPPNRMAMISMAITQSTSDFPLLLENVLNRSLLESYTAVAETWRKWCAVGSVADFRPYKRLRLGSFSNLDPLGEGAEYKHKVIPDATAEVVSIGTKANTVTLTRQAIINDDLGAFTRVSTMLGRAAARSIEADAYALLISNPVLDGDSTALFHANHSNLASGGSAAAITMTSLDAARAMLKVQKDRSSNEYIGVNEPFILLCPVAKAGAARTANESEYDPDTASKLQRVNITRGIFSAIIDTPYLSGNAWYLLANPADFPVFEVLFLNGQQTPYTEQITQTNVDGVQWLIRLDYGVNVVDYVGAFRNDGA